MLCGFSATSSEASQLMGRRNPWRKDWIGLFEILRDSLNKFTNQTNESINIGKPIFKFISGEAEEDIGIATDQYKAPSWHSSFIDPGDPNVLTSERKEKKRAKNKKKQKTKTKIKRNNSNNSSSGNTRIHTQTETRTGGKIGRGSTRSPRFSFVFRCIAARNEIVVGVVETIAGRFRINSNAQEFHITRTINLHLIS